jgi:MOSC domain-containing protein YiiM
MTAQARIESVNIGTIQDVPWGSLKASAIDKRPTHETVDVGFLGLAGDEVADKAHHGGRDQALYAYALEDLTDWATDLGRDLAPGSFGENLTTSGVDVQNARLGDRWRVGTALVEISAVRIPCSVFQGFLDERAWVKRFTERGIPGAYLRVIEPGRVRAGDAVELVESRDHDITVGKAFRALTSRRDLLPDLAIEPRVSQVIRNKIETFKKQNLL